MHAVTMPVYVALRCMPGKWRAHGAYALRHEINVFSRHCKTVPACTVWLE